MNVKLLCIPLLGIMLCGCDNSTTQTSIRVPANKPYEDADNSGRNERDRNSELLTPIDQSETEADRMITTKIRQAVVNDDNLSVNAKNIKIITRNGVVTLRGPVNTDVEKAEIVKKARAIQGVSRIDDQIEIITRK